MNFFGQSRYIRLFHQVIQKVGESDINYIKLFQNSKPLEISVGSSYSEDKFMHDFLDNFHQGGNCSTHISSHQAELSREERFVGKKSLSISDLQIDLFNLNILVIND